MSSASELIQEDFSYMISQSVIIDEQINIILIENESSSLTISIRKRGGKGRCPSTTVIVDNDESYIASSKG